MKTEISIFFLLSLFVFSCQNDDDGIVAGPQMIYQTSFENNDVFDVSGWEGSGFSYASDTPFEGGSFSLQLEPQWLPQEGALERNFTGLEGDLSFDLQFYSKTIDWEGIVQVWKVDAEGNTQPLITQTLNEAEWTAQRITFPSIFTPEEQLFLKFSAGGTEVATGKVLIDLVQFKILNP